MLSQNGPKIEVFNLSKHLQIAKVSLHDFAVYYQLTDKRSIEKQTATYVVRNVLKDDELEILYQESGKPYLQGNVKISISHSYDWLVILFSFSGSEIGVDIEKVRDKILNIKEKFLSKKELNYLQYAPIEKYTICWGAKEAIYKALNVKGLNFSEQISIDDFSYSQDGGKINVNVYDSDLEKKYTLHYQVLDNYVLVYTDNN